MTDLPDRDNLASALTTEAQFQAAIGDFYDFVSQLLFTGPPVVQTPTIDVLTTTSTFIKIDTENGTSTDNLKNILNTLIGAKVIMISSVSSSRVVTIKHQSSGTGQFFNRDAADVVLDDPRKTIVYYYDTNQWRELYRNWGLFTTSAGDIAAAKTALGLGTASAADVGTGTGQVPRVDDLGSAAFKSTGTGSGQVPLNSDLKALAYKDVVTTSDMSATGVAAGSYVAGNFTVGADGRLSAASSSGGGGASSVGQAQLKTSTGSGSITALASGESATFKGATIGLSTDSNSCGVSINVFANGLSNVLLMGSASTAMPGGEYGFDPKTYISGSGLSRTANYFQRYVTASPPYDLGDGEVAGFIYLLLDEQNNILGHYSADTPVWAYNGPTDTMPNYIDPETGKKYKIKKEKLDPYSLVNSTISDGLEMEEITQKVINKDWNLIPHPFTSIQQGQKVVLLDPMDERIRNLIDWQNLGYHEDIHKLIVDGRLKPQELLANRKGPKGLLQVSFDF